MLMPTVYALLTAIDKYLLAPASSKGSTSAHGVVIACQLALDKDAFFKGMKSDFVDLKMGIEEGRFEGAVGSGGRGQLYATLRPLQQFSVDIIR